MKTKLKLVLSTLVLAAVLILPATTALAAGTAPNVFGDNPACSGSQICNNSNGNGLFAVIKSVLSVLFIAAGIVSVIVIIVGGISYATSAGDQGRIKTAKDTILYAVIGLVVSLLSFAMVNFVLQNVKGA